MVKIACIIPSRYASTRLPGKPLRLIAGKTLIQRVYERAIQAKVPDICIVATDHKDIEAEVLRFGGRVVMTSPDHPKKDCAMATVATPLKESEYEDNTAVKVVVNQKDEALYFSRSLIPYPRHAFAVPPLKHVGIYAYRRDFLLQYAKLEQTPLEKTESLEQLRALEMGYHIAVIQTESDDIGIDTEADLARAEAYFKRRENK